MKKLLAPLAIGCGVLLCIAVAAFGILVFLAGRQAVQAELTPMIMTPQTVFSTSDASSTAAPLATAATTPQLIEGLAYIKVMAVTYTDDADPEPEGVSIDISFYNTASEPIQFSGIPINVNLKLFAYRDALDEMDNKNRELVYDGTITLDHSMTIGEMFGKYIRIPFTEINADSNSYTPFGMLEVNIDTPAQGSLSDSESGVPIYPYQP